LNAFVSKAKSFCVQFSDMILSMIKLYFFQYKLTVFKRLRSCYSALRRWIWIFGGYAKDYFLTGKEYFDGMRVEDAVKISSFNDLINFSMRFCSTAAFFQRLSKRFTIRIVVLYWSLSKDILTSWFLPLISFLMQYMPQLFFDEETIVDYMFWRFCIRFYLSPEISIINRASSTLVRSSTLLFTSLLRCDCSKTISSPFH